MDTFHASMPTMEDIPEVPKLEGRDYVCIGLVPDVSLELSADWSDNASLRGSFKITGPEKVLKKLTKMRKRADNEQADNRGILSPLHPVTIPSEDRERMQIPASAAKYC